MNIIEKAFYGLYPEKELMHDARIKYSGQFGKFNANVKYTRSKMVFGLSKQWRPVDAEIKIGLLQHLMNRVFKTNIKTLNQDYYHYFIQNVHHAIPKYDGPAILEQSFKRVNDKYFLGLTEKPNLKWGKNSTAKLGSYDYHGDTITISSIFKKADLLLIDYIIFHELLHKMHKFKITKNGRTLHHSNKFRKTEKEFEGSEILEKNLSAYVRSWKRNNPEKVLKPFKKRWRLF